MVVAQLSEDRLDELGLAPPPGPLFKQIFPVLTSFFSLFSLNPINGRVEKEDGWRVFHDKALEIEVEGFAFFLIEDLASFFQQIINFRILITGQISQLSRVPKKILVRIGRNFLSG